VTFFVYGTGSAGGGGLVPVVLAPFSGKGSRAHRTVCFSWFFFSKFFLAFWHKGPKHILHFCLIFRACLVSTN
jgi:hypothetical protein